MRYFIILFLLFSLPVHSGSSNSRILEGITPNSITVIGETHKRPEAIQYFESLIASYLQQSKCLTIALEIASSQQSLLDEMAVGRVVVDDIDIAPMIDHPSFRAFINELIKMRKHNDCLKLIAIDAGLELKTGRDEWMAEKLIVEVGESPVLALLGNLHTLKKVNWNPAITKKEPYVAEILVSQGHNVKSYPQIWMDRVCNTRNRLISANQPEAVKLLNADLFALLNASEPKAVSDIIDGVILWECD